MRGHGPVTVTVTVYLLVDLVPAVGGPVLFMIDVVQGFCDIHLKKCKFTNDTYLNES
jgi:hypothetical protein